MDTYSLTYNIRWSDLDANGHVRYSAYIDATADLRYRFFSEHGFPPKEFEKRKLGAIYTGLEAQFLREVRLGETITITYSLAGLSPEGTRWKVQHDVLKENGKKAVVIRLDGVIFDLVNRRPVTADPDLLKVMQQVPHAKKYEILSDTR